MTGIPALTFGGDQAAATAHGGNISNGSTGDWPFKSPSVIDNKLLLVGAGLAVAYFLLFRRK